MYLYLCFSAAVNIIVALGWPAWINSDLGGVEIGASTLDAAALVIIVYAFIYEWASDKRSTCSKINLNSLNFPQKEISAKATKWPTKARFSPLLIWVFLCTCLGKYIHRLRFPYCHKVPLWVRYIYLFTCSLVGS